MKKPRHPKSPNLSLPKVSEMDHGFTFSVDTNPGSLFELPPRSEVVTADDLPSSIHTVVSNDDLLIEILLRLPVISLFMFKSVSKRCLSFFKDAQFTLKLSQIPNLDPSCGLFLKIPIPTFPGFKYDFVSFDNIRIPTRRSFPFSFDSEVGRDADILQSCNGLFLCCIEKSYYVCNPSNNLYRMLPQQQQHNPNKKRIGNFGVGGMRMAFDPTKSPHYKVIYARVIHDDELGHSIQIQTFSSESISKCSTHEGSWSVCRHRFPILSFNRFKRGIYSNGAIHWLTYVNLELAHVKLDIVNENSILTSIQLPVTSDGISYNNYKLLDSRGRLLLLCRDDKLWHQLNIYEMRNGCSEWSVKYHANLNDIMTPFPKHWSIGLSAWCVVLGDREEDSFMVTELYNKVVRYNIMRKTVHTLIDLGSVSPSESFPFIASFASVILLSDSGSGDDEGYELKRLQSV